MIKDFKDEDSLQEEDLEKMDQEETDQEVKEDVEQDTKEPDNSSSEEKEDSYKDQLIRLTADFTNYKRRAEKEKKEYLQLGVKKIAMDLLAVVDNFERAMDHKDEEGDSAFYQGIEMIYNQFMDLLKKHDILPMEAEGQAFDPKYHHAVLVEEKEGVEEGQVLEVVQKGYLLKDEVLRPAMVKVSQ